MMNVSTMRKLVDDLGDQIPEPVLRAVGLWDFDTGSIQYVRSSANHVFRFLQNGHPAYLRLTPLSSQTIQRIRNELAFIDYLKHKGMQVAYPLPSNENNLFEIVQSDSHDYGAVVFKGLDGTQWLEIEDLDEHLAQEWGRALAEFHRLSQAYGVTDDFKRSDLVTMLEQASLSLPPTETQVHQTLQAGLEWLASLDITPDNYGLLHGDFQLDNLAWDGASFQVLDFDDALYGWYAYDVAVAVDDLWSDNAELLTIFLEAYQSIMLQHDDLVQMIPRFLRLRQVWQFARLLKAYEGLDAEDQPEWVNNMRARHHRWFERTRAELSKAFNW